MKLSDITTIAILIIITHAMIVFMTPTKQQIDACNSVHSTEFCDRQLRG